MHGANRRLPLVLVLVAALGAAFALAACGGESDEHDVVEGQPAHLGDLIYHVGLTRFLNPEAEEDAEYLVGLSDPPPGSIYMGVFLRVENEGEGEHPMADEIAIADIRGNRFEALESESPFALDPRATVPAHGSLPPPETALGPVAGAVLVFLVDELVIDSRPLILEISGAEGTASVQLDI